MSRQQYRDAVLKLEACGLVTFRKTNQGTIAVLTNTAIFDINAQSDEGQIKACTALEKELNYSQAITIHQSLENQKETTLEPSKEPVSDQQRTIKEPDRNQSGTNVEPLTKKEEKRAAAPPIFYKCLEGLGLSDQEKRSMMYYSEQRVAHVVEFLKRKQNVDSPIGLSTARQEYPCLSFLLKMDMTQPS